MKRDASFACHANYSILLLHLYGFLLGWIIVALLNSPCDALLTDFGSSRRALGVAIQICHRPCSLSMIHSIKIRIVGRKNSGESWLHDAYTCYETRLRGSIAVETVWHKNDAEMVSSVMADRKKQHAVILLDPRGMTYSSEQFSHQFFSWLHSGGSRASFVIGGADGLPPELNLTTMNKEHHLPAMSLSTLTMTHQFCRILLIEQIYRATEIRKGIRYLIPCFMLLRPLVSPITYLTFLSFNIYYLGTGYHK
jgi:23S rRNA (pseudouridine1915-N3)-methyltransferase